MYIDRDWLRLKILKALRFLSHGPNVFECRTQHGRLTYVQGEHSVIGQTHKTCACVKPRADPDLF